LFGDELASGDVVTLLPDWQAPALPVQLVSPPQRQHSAKVRAFGEHVARHWR
jgi:DNA-binding transcriptional LysR family regulator